VVLFFNSIIFAACPGPMVAPATVALAKQLDVPVKKVAQLSGYQLLVVGALGCGYLHLFDARPTPVPELADR
jgi:hypothetical protein